MPAARMATVMTKTIAIPARLARTGRRLCLHLPTKVLRAGGRTNLWETATGPPVLAPS